MKIEKLKIKATVISILKKIIKLCISLIMCYNLIYIILSNFHQEFELSLGNYSILIADDNTMSPAINKNDMLLIEKIVEDEIKIGDVIVTNESKTKVARIEKKISSIDKNIYIIKGDNNYFYYENEIEFCNIIGRVKKVFPQIGLLFELCQSKIITILILIWLLIKFNHYKIKIESNKIKKTN